MQPNPTTIVINHELDQCVDSFMIKYRKLALKAGSHGIPYRVLTMILIDKLITLLSQEERDEYFVDIIVGDSYYSFETKNRTDNQQILK